MSVAATSDFKLVEFPQRAAYGRIVAKQKVYENAGVSNRVRQSFVRQVDKVIWQYKLAPETTNLAATKGVSEIQVFTIELKDKELDENILRAIDKAVKFPIIFELVCSNETRMVASYKRLSQKSKLDWVVGDYFSSPWIGVNTGRTSMPTALNLQSLYEKLLERIIPLGRRSNERLDQLVFRAEAARNLSLEIDKAARNLANEKQFNRKVEINAELRKLRDDLDALRQC